MHSCAQASKLPRTMGTEMAYLLPISRILFLKGEWLQPPTSNARILVSRNKREGYYAGRVPGYRARNERVARIYSLRGPKREKVDFADLGIRLHHPSEI